MRAAFHVRAIGSGEVSGQMASLVRAPSSSLRVSADGAAAQLGSLAALSCLVVAMAQVLRIGLNSQEVGSAAGTVAGVFVRGPGLFSGHSRVDGIGYISKHQPARPLQWALGRESALQRDRQGHQNLDQSQSLVQSLSHSLPGACFGLVSAMPAA